MVISPVSCGPVRTLSELNAWTPSEHALDELTRASVPLRQDGAASCPGTQKILVCHDMAGTPLQSRNSVYH